ncbi:MAG TPA: MauE/DoxX family redox-associated membrane protein [Microlunatus sp.]|nr:MauE/DoxX family redox-associated membrane protein [Microlunatus sp.]
MTSSPTARRGRFARVSPWISTVVRVLLGGVLLAAGGLKVIDPQSSVLAVRAYQLVPDPIATLIGWGLPFAEIAIGLLLVVVALTRIAAIAAAVMMVVFIVSVSSAAARGLSIDCGCFGGGGQVAAGQTAYGAEIARDIGLLLMAVWLVWRPQSRYALEHDLERDDHSDSDTTDLQEDRT